jgi:TonB family protein
MFPLLCFSETSLIGDLLGGSIQKEEKTVTPKVKKYKFPEVIFKIQEVTGSYSEKEIKAVADYNMLGLRSIYFKYLDKGLYFAGDILLKFTIAKNGKVASVDMIHSTTWNAEFDEAIKKEIAIWKWNVTKSDNNTSTAILLFKFTAISRYNHYIIDSGPRLDREIVQIILVNMPRFRTIYMKEYFKRKPGLEGKIILRFTIAGSGEVIKADIVASTTEYAEFDEAIRKELSTWKLKPIEDGNTTVTVIFNFTE